MSIIDPNDPELANEGTEQAEDEAPMDAAIPMGHDPDAADDYDGFGIADRHGGDLDVGPLPIVDGPDGLPTVGIGPSDADASGHLPLSPRNLVCIADRTRFFRWGESDESGQQQRVYYAPEEVEPHLSIGGHAAYRLKSDQGHVYPERHQCSHLLRQMTPWPGDPEHFEIRYYCAARRDTSGAMVGLTDGAVWACDMRDPPEYESLVRLNAGEDRKIEQGRTRRKLPLGVKEPNG